MSSQIIWCHPSEVAWCKQHTQHEVMVGQFIQPGIMFMTPASLLDTMRECVERDATQFWSKINSDNLKSGDADDS